MNINQFIPSTSSISNLLGTTSSSNTQDTSNGTDFASVLKDKLNQVNDQQLNSDSLSNQFIQGGDVTVDQVMLGAEEAKMSLQMAVQVRNKLVDAYQELSKTQV